MHTKVYLRNTFDSWRILYIRVCVCVYMFVCVGGGVVGCVCLGRGVGVVDWVCVFATQNSTEYYNIFISLV